MVIVLLLLMIIINKISITPVEKVKLEDESKIIAENINTIEDKQDLDSCVIYTINYYASCKNINKVSIKDINKYIEKHFNIETSEKEVSKLGITPKMLDDRITFNPTENAYEKSAEKKTYADIAGEKIEKYLKGEESKKTIKKYITEDNIAKIGKESGKVKVTYIIKDGNILVNKIKVEK